MAKLKINGLETILPPLTYGQVKANRDLLAQVSAQGLTSLERTDASVAFLRILIPEVDLDGVAPGALIVAAVDLYMETFDRPEEHAPEKASL